MLKLPAVQVLGTPTREDIHAMNPNYTEFKFPHIKAHPWSKVFSKRLPADAVDLVSAQPCCRISHGELTVAQSSLVLLHIWGAAGCDSDKPHKTFRRQVVEMGPKFSARLMLQPPRCCLPWPVSSAHGSMHNASSTDSLAMQVSRLLQYSPVRRYSALQALTHPFFDELRDQSVTLPNGEPPHSALLFRWASCMCCPHMPYSAKACISDLQHDASS